MRWPWVPRILHDEILADQRSRYASLKEEYEQRLRQQKDDLKAAHDALVVELKRQIDDVLLLLDEEIQDNHKYLDLLAQMGFGVKIHNPDKPEAPEEVPQGAAVSPTVPVGGMLPSRLMAKMSRKKEEEWRHKQGLVRKVAVVEEIKSIIAGDQMVEITPEAQSA